MHIHIYIACLIHVYMYIVYKNNTDPTGSLSTANRPPQHSKHFLLMLSGWKLGYHQEQQWSIHQNRNRYCLSFTTFCCLVCCLERLQKPWLYAEVQQCVQTYTLGPLNVCSTERLCCTNTSTKTQGIFITFIVRHMCACSYILSSTTTQSLQCA